MSATAERASALMEWAHPDHLQEALERWQDSLVLSEGAAATRNDPGDALGRLNDVQQPQIVGSAHRRTASARMFVPTICGMRIPIATVVLMVADGMTVAQICGDIPDLEPPEDVAEALHYAAGRSS